MVHPRCDHQVEQAPRNLAGGALGHGPGGCEGEGLASLGMGGKGAVAAVGVEVDRAIRTGKLHALPRFHIRPIDVVVCHGSDSETWF